MSIPLKKEKDLLSNKNISASNILTKRENLSNDKKRNIIDSIKEIPINTSSLNISKNLFKTFKIKLDKKMIHSTSNPSISSNSNSLKFPLKEVSESNKSNKTKINNIQYNKSVNFLNSLFDQIQKLYLQNNFCCNECISWIENFQKLNEEILEINKQNEFLDLIKNTLIMMLFTMIMVYDMNNQNKQKLFIDDMKKIMNIHSLMSESIFSNSFNNPNINHKDESEILMLSIKDILNRLKKIINQYSKINDKIAQNLNNIFKQIKNVNFNDLMNFFNEKIKNPNHEKIPEKKNKNNINIYEHNNINKNLKSINTYIDEANNYYYMRNPLNIETQKKKVPYSQYTNRTTNSKPTFYVPQNYPSYKKDMIFNNNDDKKNKYSNNYLIQNDPRFNIIIQDEDKTIFSRYKNLKKKTDQIENKSLSINNIPNIKNPNLTNINYLIPFKPIKPYTLVLDLDETLIHVPKGKKYFYSQSLILRPGLIDFLRNLKEFYELIIFTSSLKEYADKIIDFIEKDEKYFSYRLYRDNAVIINNMYYKDLNILGRDLKKIIIIDDKKQHILQNENSIIIKPFISESEDNNNDFILFDLILILIRIANEKPDDIRKSLKNYGNEINNKISN